MLRGHSGQGLVAVLLPMLMVAGLSLCCKASVLASGQGQGSQSAVSSWRRHGRGDSSPPPLLRLRGAGERGRGHDVIPRRRLVKGKRSSASAGNGGGGGSLFPEGTQVPNPIGLFSTQPSSGIGLGIQGQGQQPAMMGQGQVTSSHATPFGQLGSFPGAPAGAAPTFRSGSTFGGQANPFGALSSPPAAAASGSPAAAAAAGGMGQPGGAGGFGNSAQIPSTGMVFGSMQAGGGANIGQGGAGFGVSQPTPSFSFGPSSSANAPGVAMAGNQSSPFGMFGGAGVQAPQQTSPFGAPNPATGGTQHPSRGAAGGRQAGGFKFGFGGVASSEGDAAASSAGQPPPGGGDGGFKFGATALGFGAGFPSGPTPPLGGEIKSPLQATPFSFGPSSGASFGGGASSGGQFLASKPTAGPSPSGVGSFAATGTAATAPSTTSGMARFGGWGGTSTSPFSLPSANVTSRSPSVMFGARPLAAGQPSSSASSVAGAEASPPASYKKGTFLGLSKGGSANFGFIRPSDGDGTDNVFVHGSNLPEGLEAGAPVEYCLALHEQVGAGLGAAGVGAGEERKQAVNVRVPAAGGGTDAGAVPAGAGAGGEGMGDGNKPSLSELFGGGADGGWTCDTCMVSNKALADKVSCCLRPLVRVCMRGLASCFIHP